MKKTNQIKSALEIIKSDDIAKRKLRDDVLRELGKKKATVRRINLIRLIALSFVAVAAVFAGAGTYYYFPVSGASIDIGSAALQLELSAAGRVVDYYSGAGEVGFSGGSLREAAEAVIRAAAPQGEGAGLIAVISAHAGSAEAEKIIDRKLGDELIACAAELGIPLSVYHVDVTREMISHASLAGVTSGRYYLMSLVRATDPGFSGESLPAEALMALFVKNYSEGTIIIDNEVPLAASPSDAGTTEKSGGAAIGAGEISEQYERISEFLG